MIDGTNSGHLASLQRQCLEAGAEQDRTTGTITPTGHCCDEWVRLANDAYATGHNAQGHRFSVAAATFRGHAMFISAYDRLQAVYRQWLNTGWRNIESMSDFTFTAGPL